MPFSEQQYSSPNKMQLNGHVLENVTKSVDSFFSYSEFIGLCASDITEHSEMNMDMLILWLAHKPQ